MIAIDPCGATRGGGGGVVGSEIPFIIVLPLVFSSIVYWLVGFNTIDPWRFVLFYAWCARTCAPGTARTVGATAPLLTADDVRAHVVLVLVCMCVGSRPLATAVAWSW